MQPLWRLRKLGSLPAAEGPDIDRDILHVEIGFAPLRPAESVVIQLQQMARWIGSGDDA